MTTEIEQAFFEAWGIDEEYYEFISTLGEVFTANSIEEFKTKYPNDCLIGQKTKKKRELTPSRILALLLIIINHSDMCMLGMGNTFEGKFGLWFRYRYRPSHMKQEFEAEEETFENALLSLLTQLKPELSDEVQEEVRAVFG